MKVLNINYEGININLSLIYISILAYYCVASLVESNFEQSLSRRHNLLFIFKFVTVETFKMIFLGQMTSV